MSKPVHPLLEEMPAEELVTWNGINVHELKEWNQEKSGDIFLTENLAANEVVSEVFNKKINHLVQKNAKRFSTDLKVAKDLIERRQNYFLPEFSFIEPEKKILVPFSGKEDKPLLKDKISLFIEEASNASVSQSAQSIFEEMFMNAVIDAPKEAEKRNMPASDKGFEFFLAAGGDSLQISCTDYYGSLETSKLLARMHEVYEKGAGEVINLHGTGGAGIGCVLLFENSLSLIIGVNPGHQTKVTSILPLGVSNRQREKMQKSLHWFHI